jgi:SAM-dependent methyltransferase
MSERLFPLGQRDRADAGNDRADPLACRPSTTAAAEPGELDPDRAIQRGHPSYLWRAGQERRLNLVRRYVPLDGRRILDVGCGLGRYTEALSQRSGQVYGVEVELERAVQAHCRSAGVVQAVGEDLPFASDTFDLVFSNEVLEHVTDDRQVVREMVRVARPGAYVVAFAPNRLWPWETHGIYWRGRYRFGNIPLINYLPTPLRNRLAWHVRAYTRRGLMGLFAGLPVEIVHLSTVYPGFDNVTQRSARLGYWARAVSYRCEQLPLLNRCGLSHLLAAQKRKGR